MKEGQFVKEMITLDTLQKEKGLRKRASFIAESKDLFFVFRPTFDLITSQQALPPSYTLGLEFERAPQTFSLLTAADNPQQYKIRLYDFHLEVRLEHALKPCQGLRMALCEEAIGRGDRRAAWLRLVARQAEQER